MSWHVLWPWLAFLGLIFLLLAIDLGVFHRRVHAVGMREAIVWSVVWVIVALVFNAIIYVWKGRTPALEFLTGYVIERALSFDNIFIFVLIFNFFRVPGEMQHRVLFWGILGALIMRAVLIGTGTALLARFHWVEYLFGAFLIYSAFKMAREHEPEIHPEGNRVVRLFRRLYPVTSEYDGARFFTRVGTATAATPLFVVLLLVETTDVVFAFDSIPAIFAVTRDPFIIFTSNIFAILGLRALYFLLASVISLFEYLNLGLALVLAFVGVKMLLPERYEIPITWSLLIVFAILALSIGASLLKRRRSAGTGESAEP